MNMDGAPLALPEDPRAEELRGASALTRWWYALKPASWPKLLVPAALGQFAGALHARALDPLALLLGLTFSVGLLVFIVLVNDWSDADVDRLKRALYPSDCSPKTIPDQLLSETALLRAGLAALALALLAAFAAGQLLGRVATGWSALACAGIFVAYSLPPLRLNYRGGGELLEAAGVGLALPMWNAYVQAGAALPPTLRDVLPAFFVLALASALASGLSDEVSDRRGGKRTFTTLLGNPNVRVAVLACTCAGAALYALVPLVGAPAGRPALWAGGVGAASCLVAWARMRAVVPPPTTDAFASQARFKQRLHGAIWYGSLAVMLSRALLVGTQ
jgi:1,4-dihydroxy-2-naphthoate octaprenyltransferase/chlorophyll synthase